MSLKLVFRRRRSWKAGYDVAATPITIGADAFVQIDARVLPEPDPDAVWTA
jgi:acetyltransferase-like isoleucine patch superfamily enzyme